MQNANNLEDTASCRWPRLLRSQQPADRPARATLAHPRAEGAVDVAQQAQRVGVHLRVVRLDPGGALGPGHVVADVLEGD